jgi:hypothetical protein
MKRTFGWVVVAALTASALVLGGCVAEAEDEEEAPVGQAGTALVIAPELPKQEGGEQTSGKTDPAPSPTDPGANQSGSANMDPEPSPWDVGRTTH